MSGITKTLKHEKISFSPLSTFSISNNHSHECHSEFLSSESDIIKHLRFIEFKI